MILADGFEEIEAVTPIDVLRRAGLEVTVAGLGGKKVLGSRRICIEADIALSDYQGTPDAVILPGGMPGARNLSESKEVADIVKRVDKSKKIVSAICAAPALALTPTGVLNGKKATCYPGFENNFTKEISYTEDRVVVDGHVITSRGPGSSFEFALRLVEELVSREKADELREIMLVQ